MIRNLTRYVLMTIVLVFSAIPVQAAAEKYILDDNHSYVLWHIKHLGFSTQAGKWYVKGFILLDEDKPQNSKVVATVEVASLITGLPDLDKHLKDKLFFDIKTYPKATFVSNKVEPLTKTTANVEGILTVHGVAKPITLKVTFNKKGKNPITDKLTVGFSATTDLLRSAFGINTLLPDLGDEVNIEIDAEAYKAN